MEFAFRVLTEVKLEHKQGKSTSKHGGTKFNLQLSENLQRDKYLEDGLPNKIGSEVVTMVLVQGLIANIHLSHQKGFRDSAEHLRFIISELERGFIEVAEIGIATF